MGRSRGGFGSSSLSDTGFGGGRRGRDVAAARLPGRSAFLGPRRDRSCRWEGDVFFAPCLGRDRLFRRRRGRTSASRSTPWSRAPPRRAPCPARGEKTGGTRAPI